MFRRKPSHQKREINIHKPTLSRAQQQSLQLSSPFAHQYVWSDRQTHQLISQIINIPKVYPKNIAQSIIKSARKEVDPKQIYSQSSQISRRYVNILDSNHKSSQNNNNYSSNHSQIDTSQFSIVLSKKGSINPQSSQILQTRNLADPESPSLRQRYLSFGQTPRSKQTYSIKIGSNQSISTALSKQQTRNNDLTAFKRNSANFHMSLQSRRFRTVRKLRVTCLCVIFIRKMRKRCRRYALNRKLLMEARVIDLNKIVQRMIEYYNRILKVPLQNYVRIIKVYKNNPLQVSYSTMVTHILLGISELLKNSSITASMADMFYLTALSGGFVPSGFLSKFEIDRLQFSETYGCLRNVSPEATKMITGIFLGVRVLCQYILFKPWEGIDSERTVDVKDYPIYRVLVQNTGSTFYEIVMNEFRQMPLLKSKTKKQLLQFLEIRSAKPLQIIPENFKDQVQGHRAITQLRTELIPYFDNKFYEAMQNMDREGMTKIRINVRAWLDKIYDKIRKGPYKITKEQLYK